MGNPLFDRRSASDFGEAGLVIDFKEKIDCFERLSAAVATDLSALDDGREPENWRDSPVSGELEFGISAQQPRVTTLSGRVVADVDAVCQRCLEPFSVRLSASLSLLLQAAGEDVADQDGFDVWELDEPTVRAADIVDEILVMSLPLSARHEEENCEKAAPEAAVAEETTRPFADLRQQMDQEN